MGPASLAAGCERVGRGLRGAVLVAALPAAVAGGPAIVGGPFNGTVVPPREHVGILLLLATTPRE